MTSLSNTSVADVYRIIKQFHFDYGRGTDPYKEITFSDSTKIRLDKNGRVKLKRQPNGKYSTDVDIWFRTRTTNPKAVRKLLMFQLLPNKQNQYAEIYARIYNGTDDLYWDGGAWSIAGANDWNTEAVINENIEDYPILPDREFAVTVNLRTNDPYLDATPYIEEVRVLMEVHIDFIEDIIFRSLLPSMQDNIFVTGNYGSIQPYTTDVSQIDFSLYRKNTPYNITDVIGVYDITDDNELLYNLLDNYNSTTEIITLLVALPAGNVPLILFKYSPEYVYTTHQDWLEVAKVPVFFIQRLEVPVEEAYGLSSREGIVDKGTGNAVVVDEPWRATLQFRLHGLASKAVDQVRMITRMIRYFEENKFISSVGLDELYRMRIQREFRDITNPGRSDLRAFWTMFEIKDVKMPFISRDTNAVTQLNVTFSEPYPPHEDPIKGGNRVVEAIHDEGSPKRWTDTTEIT